jgi:hypothetical protein
MGASKSFGDERVPPGMQHRSGTLGDAIDDLRSDIDNAFLSLEGATKSMAVAEYDFDVLGGTIGAIDLVATLPVNAYILRSWYEVETTFQSATDAGTVALGVTGDTATINAAVAISDGSNPYDAGLFDGDNDGTAANASTKTAAEVNFVLTVAVEDLTAGKLKIFAEYIEV